MATVTGYESYPVRGIDKHHGKHVSYLTISIDGDTRNFYCWSRCSHSGSVDVIENTNGGSTMKQYQVMREEPPQFETELYLPYDITEAKEDIEFLIAGKVIDYFTVQGLFKTDYLRKFGKWVIERSSLDLSKDQLATVRATIRALGYTAAENLAPAPHPNTANPGAPYSGQEATVTESGGVFTYEEAEGVNFI